MKTTLRPPRPSPSPSRRRAARAWQAVSRLLLPFFCAALLLVRAGHGQDDGDEGDDEAAGQEEQTDDTRSSPVHLTPRGGTLGYDQTLAVSFAAPMVPPARVGEAAPAAANPLRFDPPVGGRFVWKSPTDGEFLVTGPLVPGHSYRAALAPGLRDAAGQPVAAPAVLGAFHTEPFTAEGTFDPTAHLASRPSLVVKFTYPVRLGDAAEHVYFQDRDSRARQPARILLRDADNQDESAEGTYLRVEPRAPLPLGRTFDLILDQVRESRGGQPLAYLHRLPLGTTAPLAVKWVAATNNPLEAPAVHVRFDDFLDPATVAADALGFDPPVPGLRVRADDDDLVATGAFDLRRHYQVTVGTAVKGRSGFGLSAPARWGATFRPRASALFFPEPRLWQRARLGLRFSFLQVRTGPASWRLAAVPLEKLPLVEARLREFEAARPDPVTGEPQTNDLGYPLPHPTELLVDGLGLPERARGELPASPGEEPVPRDLRWQPGPGEPALAGPYLLEITAPAGDDPTGRRRVAHRSLVTFSEVVLTQKRTPETLLVRVAGMADGLPRPGVRVRAVTGRNFERARGTTDAAGLVAFPVARLKLPAGEAGGRREQRPGPDDEPARLFVADTPDGPAVQALDADDFTPAIAPGSAAPAPAQSLRAVVLTDRTLYRPGHVVLFKGLVRVAGRTGPLRVPAGETVRWSVQRGFGASGPPAAEGEAAVSADGGWEGAWTIPPDAPLGRYQVSCRLDPYPAGRGGPPTGEFQVEEFKTPLYEVQAEELPRPPADDAPVSVRVRARYFSGQPVAGGRLKWRATWRRDNLEVAPATRPDAGWTRTASGDNDDGEGAGGNYLFSLDDQHSEQARPSADAGGASAAGGPPSAAGAPAEKPPEEVVLTGDLRLDPAGEAVVTVTPPPRLPGARDAVDWELAVASAEGQSVAAAPLRSRVMRQPVLLGVSLTAEPPPARPDPDPDPGAAPTAASPAAPATAAAAPPRALLLRTAFFDRDDHPAAASAATPAPRVQLYRIETKTVREEVAPFVTRYRNRRVYQPLPLPALAPPPGGGGGADDVRRVPVARPGEYVVVVTAPGLRPVSAAHVVDGPGADEVPVQNATSLWARFESGSYRPGQRAALLTRTPVTGVAWVSVETDQLLDTLIVPLPGNTTRIEFPVKPEYAPNAHVAVYLLRPGDDRRLPAERFVAVDLPVARPELSLAVDTRLAAGTVRPGGQVSGTVEVRSLDRPVPDAELLVYAVDDALLVLGAWQPPDLLDLFYPHRAHQVATYGALSRYAAGVNPRSLYQKGFVVGGGGEEPGSKFVRHDFRPLAFWRSGLKTDEQGRAAFAFTAPDNLTRYRIVAVAQTRVGQFGLSRAGVVEVAKPLAVEPALPRFLRGGDEVELRAVVRRGPGGAGTGTGTGTAPGGGGGEPVAGPDQLPVEVSCQPDAGLTLLGGPGAAAAVLDRSSPGVFRFRARVNDVPGAQVRFVVTAPADPALADAVEVNLPVLPPTTLRRESVTGAWPSAGAGAGTGAGTGVPSPAADPTDLLPADWRRAAAGRFDLVVSTNPDLGRLTGLPAILGYPYGCLEQTTTQTLVYLTMAELLDALPLVGPRPGERDADPRAVVEATLRLYARNLLADDQLPYWPGGKSGHPFVTALATYAVRLAAARGYEVPAELPERLNAATKRLLDPPARDPAGPGDEDGGDGGELVRALALLARANPEDAPAARAAYQARAGGSDETRAVLALALHAAKILPAEKTQLLRELSPRLFARPGAGAPAGEGFDQRTFRTAVTARARVLWAVGTIAPNLWTPAQRADARRWLETALERAGSFSTQENLWTLTAYRAWRGGAPAARLVVGRSRPAPGRFAPNGTAAAWLNLPLGGPGPRLEGLGPAAVPLTYLAQAEYRLPAAEAEARRDRGLRLERVVRNLTDPARTGQPGEPAVRLRDQLLVTYRLACPRAASYLALEDPLPAGLSLVNPDLPSVAAFYDVPPPAPGEKVLGLSSSNLRDDKAELFFDAAGAGVNTYSVLVRADAAGTFRWPAAQVTPMYQVTLGGSSASAELAVGAEP